MAKIDDLVAQIADPKLRAELEKSVKELKKNTRFGLVFEDHIPEMSALVGLPLTVGELAMRRDAPSGRAARTVKAIHSGGTVTLEDKDGNTSTEPASDWLAAKQFGQPIYPGLEKVGEVKRGGADRPHHAVINAENYHAAQLLLYLYEGQVDCIYLDPPYNTGAKDWTYNNDYVDSSDAWRHSKWLSFMEKRLKLAKRLLKHDGVLIVTIDEHEVHHLGMLLEELFPEYSRQMVTIVISPQGNDKDNFSRVDEYAFFCCPKIGNVINDSSIDLLPKNINKNLFDEDDEEKETEKENDISIESRVVTENARRRGAESLRADRPSMFLPIFIDEEKKVIVRSGDPLPEGISPSFEKIDNLRPVWPIDSNGDERRWRWGKKTTDELIEKKELVLGKYNAGRDTWTINRVQVLGPKRNLYKTVWWHSSHSAGSHGSGVLEKLLGKGQVFPFPKSIYAVRDCIAAVVRNRPYALIIDLFSGSGTTFHATCLLNSEDGGYRRSILVTNNEVSEDAQKPLKEMGFRRGDAEFEAEGIFEKVTRRRCEAVVTGLRPDGTPIPGTHIGGRAFSEGFEENVSFFKLNYLDPDSVDIGMQFAAIAPALWLAAGAVGECETQESAAGFLIPEGAKYGVLFDEKRLPVFVAALQTRPEVTHAFLVTDSNEAFSEMKPELPHTISNVQMLYRDYLRSFRIQ